MNRPGSFFLRTLASLFAGALSRARRRSRASPAGRDRAALEGAQRAVSGRTSRVDSWILLAGRAEAIASRAANRAPT